MPRLIPHREIEQMVAMFHAGLYAEDIADAFHLSTRAVYDRLAKRKLRYRRVASKAHRLGMEVRQGQIHRLRGQGYSVSKMAMYLGLRPRTLRAWMARHMPGLYDQMKAEQRARAMAPPKVASTAPRPPGGSGPAPLTRWRRAAIKRAYLAGDTLAVIAARYGHHATTIWRLLRRQRVQLRTRTAHLAAHGAHREPAG